VTGWFAEFGALASAEREGVQYTAGPMRFAGATYDPTSHYRAAAVFDFFEEQGLDPELLREVSRHQRRVLTEGIDALDLDPAVLDRDRSAAPEVYAGFVALRSPVAGELLQLLEERGVATDRRGDVLRLGPAPYLSDRQLERAVAALGESVRALRG
jgi:kynureninase